MSPLGSESERSAGGSARDASAPSLAAPSPNLAVPPLFHVVLHEPEIPNNTGNIGRTCVATHCALHLIRPLGFDTSEKACRRAGLDYWARLKPTEHDSFDAYRKACFASGPRAGSSSGGSAPVEHAAPIRPEAGRVWLFTTKRGVPFYRANFQPGDHLIFGKETRGLPEAILDQYPARLVSFPMAQGERSLNLATAVCAAVYEGLRQLIAAGSVGISGENRLIVGPGFSGIAPESSIAGAPIARTQA